MDGYISSSVSLGLSIGILSKLFPVTYKDTLEYQTYSFHDLVKYALHIIDKRVGILESACNIKASYPCYISLIIDHWFERLVNVN